MPRNGSGNFSLAEPAFNPGTPISSGAVNSDFSDIADALTESLARDGQGGMTAVLPLANTGFTYLTDPNTGMRRTGADTQAIQCGGVDVVTATPTGASVVGTLAVSGPISQNGFALLPIGIILPYAGPSAPAGYLLCFGQSLLRASYANLFTAIGTAYGAVDGTHFSLPDLRGRIPAGADNMGGVAASRLTAATMVPDGQTLGAVNTASGGQVVTLALAHLPTGITAVNATQAISVATVDFVITKGTQPISSATGGGTEASYAIASGAQSVHAASTGSNSISVTSNNTSGAAHSNMQPTIVTNFIIYAGV